MSGLKGPAPPAVVAKMAPPASSGWLWKALVGAAVALAVIGLALGLGLGLGLKNKSSGGGSSSSQSQGQWEELPPPGSSEAQVLINNPATPGYILGIYQQVNDSRSIDPNITERFLTQLQNNANMLGANVSLQAAIGVASAVLELLQMTQATAMLTLLRGYAYTGRLDVTSVDYDQLHTEAKRVLSQDMLEQYYRNSIQRDHPGNPDYRRRWVVASQSNNSSGSTTAGRRLHQHLRHPHAAGRTPRRLGLRRRLAAAARIPVINGPEVNAVSDVPTNSPEVTMEQMICDAQRFTPNPSPQCKGRDSYGIYRYQKQVFKPVQIPVIFHCFRYVDSSNKLQPPYWDGAAAAEHLLSKVNDIYKGTGISFKLAEMRTDPKQHPYLMVDGGLDGWQDCATSPSSQIDGFSCVSGRVRENAPAGYGLNVAVTGSTFSSAYCNASEPYATCMRVFLGYSNTNGPWMPTPSATWSEENMDENWVHILYDYISPDIKNSDKVWNGGAVTTAHEFGHYLGLRHTHEGECAGEGLGSGDAIADTPNNLNVDTYAAQQRLTLKLAQWCQSFRKGQKPATDILLKFRSCPGQPNGTIDNVFNILSYVPDECCMIFTTNQVARMQWAITNFRPKLMAAFAV